MLKKIAIALGVLALGFAFGTSATIIYAHIIPGVDRPFDPANYYSLDTISAADSAPSAFALRDLAAQGGQVYDYSRHIKSIEAAKQFLSQLSILLEQNTINENDIKPLDSNTVKKLNSDYDAAVQIILEKNIAIDSSHYAFKRNLSDGYSSMDTSDYYKEQGAYLDGKYKAIASAAKKQSNGTTSILDALESTISALDNTVGREQLLQTKSHLLALNGASNLQTQELFALLIQLKQLKNMQRADDTAVDTAKKIGTSLHVLDPYNEVEKNMINSYYDYFGKEKYEAKSMPNFR